VSGEAATIYQEKDRGGIVIIISSYSQKLKNVIKHLTTILYLLLQTVVDVNSSKGEFAGRQLIGREH